jgi:hypothetical protein
MNCDFGLGGRLPRSHANRLQLESGLGNSYLFNDNWNAKQYCASWETGINDWWYEQEYIDWIKQHNKTLESSPQWIEKETILTVTN